MKFENVFHGQILLLQREKELFALVYFKKYIYFKRKKIKTNKAGINIKISSMSFI